MSFHGLEDGIVESKKKTREESEKRARKEAEESTRRGRDDRHRHRGGADYITSFYSDQTPALKTRLLKPVTANFLMAYGQKNSAACQQAFM
jgi:septal ring factor EnvC (AmiA/AmiB activator)